MSKLNVTEEDGAPSTFPYKIKFANGTVTDNGDGTTSVSNSGGGGANPAGSGSELNARLNGTTFQAVTNSSISGANLTLGGSLTLNQNGQPSLVIAPTGTDQWEESWDGNSWIVVDKTTGQTLIQILANGYAFLPGNNLVIGTNGTSGISIQNVSSNAVFNAKTSFTFNAGGNQIVLPTIKPVGGNFVQTDATGAWTYAAGSGSTSPGGANTNVQYNDSSVFGGDSGFTWNKTNKALTIGGVAQPSLNYNPTSGDNHEDSWDGASRVWVDTTTGQYLFQVLKTGQAFFPGNSVTVGSGGTSSVSFINSAGNLSIVTTGGTTTMNGTLTVPTLGPSVALSSNPTTTTQSAYDNSTKIATTAYVDSAVAGQDYKEACKYATTAALPTVIYNNGASGVGATLTGVALAAISVDSNSPAVADRILVKNQVSDFQNGIYTVTATGSGIAVFILTRATDANQSQEWKTGDAVFITAGTTLANTTFIYSGIDSPTMGTTSMTFAQIAGPGSITSGNGITVTGLSVAIDTSVTVDKTTAQTLTNKTFGTTFDINGATQVGYTSTPTSGDQKEDTWDGAAWTVLDKTTGQHLLTVLKNGVTMLPGNTLIVGEGGTSSVSIVNSSGNATINPTGTFGVNVAGATQFSITSTGESLFNRTTGFRFINNGGGGNRTIDWTQSNSQKITLNANATLTFTAPSNPTHLTLVVIQDAVGSWLITWPTTKWAGSAAPTLTTTANGIDIVTFFYDGATYYGAANTNFG